jgi:hypothetical protein
MIRPIRKPSFPLHSFATRCILPDTQRRPVPVPPGLKVDARDRKELRLSALLIEGRLNNACPSCAAVYSVQPQHIGRRIPCKKCGAALIVTVEGLGLDTEPAAGGPEPTALSSSPELEDFSLRRVAKRPSQTSAGLGGFLSWLRDGTSGVDLPLWTFGVGLSVVLVTFIVPLADQVQVERLETASATHLARENRREQAWKDKEDVEESVRQNAREAAHREQTRLQELLEIAKEQSLRWRYGCLYGTLVGLLLVAIAALGFLAQDRSTTRSVCGAVVLAALALLPLLAAVLSALRD